MIMLYDLGPTLLQDQSLGVSTHTRKIVLILKYKKIPYEHKFLLFSEIQAAATSVGAPPTATRPDGTPKYTVPFLYDSTKGRAVADSFLIAQYLDEAYPETPVVIPTGTRILQSIASEAIAAKANIPRLIREQLNKQMTPVFLEELLKVLGATRAPGPLSPEELKDGWAKAKADFDELEKSFGEDLYVMGEKPIYADFCLAASLLLAWVVCGPQSEEWKEVKGWAGGRVGRICEGILEAINA